MALASVACSQLAAAPAPEVTTSAPTPTSTPETAPAPYQIDDATLPRGFQAIGKPCDPEPNALAIVCHDDRIVGMYQPGDSLLQRPPASATILVDKKLPGGRRGASLLVAVDGERLWINEISAGSGCPPIARSRPPLTGAAHTTANDGRSPDRVWPNRTSRAKR